MLRNSDAVHGGFAAIIGSIFILGFILYVF